MVRASESPSMGPLFWWLPMTAALAVKLSTGTMAKGSWMLWRMLSHSLIVFLVPGSSTVARAMKSEGPSATNRVIMARCHGRIRRSRNPSITTWPAKVVDMVEAWPAARSPTAQTVSPKDPSVVSSASPAPSRPISSQVAGTIGPSAAFEHASPVVTSTWSVGTQARLSFEQDRAKKKCANVPTTAKLMKKLNKSATADSMKLYMFASFTASSFSLSSPTVRDLTSPLWRYKLCGMMTAPRVPTAVTAPERCRTGTAIPYAMVGTGMWV
mmetsp:Transcript_28264/g.63108  ORF Transcript_28264/g.63108 Transcript_28264/m.63108 type:complete len:269 (-) Transcript_28264:549-1355(-)